MADHPLRSATDRRLGRPLPHQLANQTQAHPLPINLWPDLDVDSRYYEVLIPVSRGYPSARGRLPTRYSPVRRFPLNLSSEESIMSFSLDLHVLITPPAFILSQDQTLNKIVSQGFRLKIRLILKLLTLSVSLNSNPELLLCLVLEIVGNIAFTNSGSYMFLDSFWPFGISAVQSMTQISTLWSFQCSRLLEAHSLCASFYIWPPRQVFVNNFFKFF